ncbi:MAG TPA: hypothetical protein VK487_00840 [Candidatus Bathyarchaeia archaeon]|nr:hypothetical protein [Candidatus Bathyarchaeia archaeon]
MPSVPYEVASGGYVLGIGFDLLGRLGKNVTITWKDFSAQLSDTPLDEIEYEQIRDFSPQLARFDIQEFAIHNAIREWPDEFLLRLYRRKNLVMTEKGMKGYVTIKIFDQDIVLYDLLSNRICDRKVIQYSDDFEQVKDYPYEKGREHKIGQSYKTRIRAYLHISLKEKGNSRDEWEVSRVANISTFVEHMPAKGEFFDYYSFLKSIRSLYVNLDDHNAKGLIKKEEIDVLRTHVLQGEFRPPEFPEKTPLFDLYSFLTYIAWAKVVEKTRELVMKRSQVSPEQYSCFKESPELKPFIQALQESRPDVSFEIVSIKLLKTPSQYGSLSLRDSSQEWVNFVTDFLVDTKNVVGSDLEGIRRRVKCETILTSQNEYFYENNALYFSNFDQEPDTAFYRDHWIDFEEWGHRSSRSWAIMLVDMLCSLSETFLLHNAEIEIHVDQNKKIPKLHLLAQKAVGKEQASEMRRLTQEAMKDFRSYYDVDILANSFYKESFETAKFTFKIDSYYKRLQERLELFSNFEIASENASLNKRILLLTIIVVAVGVLQLLAFLLK